MALTGFPGSSTAATTGGDTTPGDHPLYLGWGRLTPQQWGGITISIDALNSIPYYSGTTLGPRSLITLGNGFYYSFRVLDPGIELSGPLSVAVMKTSSPPVTLTRANQTPVVPMPGDPIKVTISTSQARSLEERIYLRWTTDTYITSHMIPATGNGTTYSATIPGQVASTSVSIRLSVRRSTFPPLLLPGRSIRSFSRRLTLITHSSILLLPLRRHQRPRRRAIRRSCNSQRMRASS